MSPKHLRVAMGARSGREPRTSARSAMSIESWSAAWEADEMSTRNACAPASTLPESGMHTKSFLTTALVSMTPFLAHAELAAAGQAWEQRDAPAPCLCAACDPAEPGLTALVPLDASALQPAIEAFDRTCGLGYVWCSMASVEAYELVRCEVDGAPAPEPTMEGIIQALTEHTQSLLGVHFERGRVFDRGALPETPFFGTSYSPAGPELLAAMDAFAGHAEVQAWLLSTSLACHNCSEFQDTGVLWYPATGVVIVLRGVHGYDS